MFLTNTKSLKAIETGKEEDIHFVLKKYWGYQSFRALQESIIGSVLEGKDTIALLPTGGGKSVCFQVPAMCSPGICIVVSPLIALMKDQVFNLQKKGIKAQAINSSMSAREIDYAFDNAVFGNTKFLYVSPERLHTDMFQERVKKMKVSLIAIDEAHCISEWGYDFRPAYLDIASIRQIVPNAPFIALTATATPRVVLDIGQKLELNNPQVFQKSFSRKNLAYLVLKEEDKYNRLISIARKTKGTGIVYVATRKSTWEISDLLRANGVASEAYHAGLDHKVREEVQEKWMKNKTRVIVSTNAFGMGIDKPDVRFVVHLDIPDNPEAYFQEAGRAGRDELKAYAVILYHGHDLATLREKVEKQFPDLKFIKSVYQAIANFFQLAVGSAMDQSFIFNLVDFSKSYKLNPLSTLYAIKILEQSGYFALSDSFYSPSRVQFMMRKNDLYSFEVGHPKLEGIIQVLLRSYSGLFDQLKAVNEYDLARKLKVSVEVVFDGLRKLKQFGVIEYISSNDKPYLTFLKPRQSADSIKLDPEFYEKRKRTAMDKLGAMEKYVQNELICRSRMLVDYFGEKHSEACGICDVCLSRKKMSLSANDYEEIKAAISELLKSAPHSLESLIEVLGIKKDSLLEVLRNMADNNEVELDYTTNTFIA